MARGTQVVHFARKWKQWITCSFNARWPKSLGVLWHTVLVQLIYLNLSCNIEHGSENGSLVGRQFIILVLLLFVGLFGSAETGPTLTKKTNQMTFRNHVSCLFPS